MIPLHYVRLWKACDEDPTLSLQATPAWKALSIGVAQAPPPGRCGKPGRSASADMHYPARTALWVVLPPPPKTHKCRNTCSTSVLGGTDTSANCNAFLTCLIGCSQEG